MIGTYPAIIAFAAATFSAGTVRAGPPIAERADLARQLAARSPADYHTDDAFKSRVTLSRGTNPVSVIIDAVSAQTGRRIAAEARLRERRLAVAVEEQPAFEVMGALARVCRAGWVRVGEAYVLATDPRLAPVTLLTREERTAAMVRAFNQLCDSLTPSQRDALQATGTLSLDPGTTTPAQQGILRDLGLLAGAYGLDPAPAALNGGGFTLQVDRVRTESGAAFVTLDLRLTQSSGSWFSMLTQRLGPSSP
jgi:hypothetical protein